MNDLKLLSLLGGIDRILFITECKNVLLVGDINCDFSRPSYFVQSIRTFAEEKGWNIFWNLSDNDQNEEVSYTYRNTVNNITHTSTFDHFLIGTCMESSGFTRTFKYKNEFYKLQIRWLRNNWNYKYELWMSNDQCRLFVHNFAYFSLF